MDEQAGKNGYFRKWLETLIDNVAKAQEKTEKETTRLREEIEVLRREADITKVKIAVIVTVASIISGGVAAAIVKTWIG